MILNPNYNPNDPKSLRYINENMSYATGQNFTPANMTPAPINYTPISTPAPKAPATYDPTAQVRSTINQVKSTINTPQGQTPKGTVAPGAVPTASKPGATVTPPATTTGNPMLPQNIDGSANLEEIANLAGKAGMSMDTYLKIVEKSTGLSLDEQNQIRNKLGVDKKATELYTKPDKGTEQLYLDFYNESGLKDIKSRVADIDAKIAGLKEKAIQATKEHYDNPYISASTRSARIARDKGLYNDEITNYVDIRKSLLDEYNQGVGDIEKRIGFVTNDRNYNQKLTEGHLNYLLNEAERQTNATQADKSKLGLRYVTPLMQGQIAETRRKENFEMAKIKANKASSSAGGITPLAQTILANPKLYNGLPASTKASLLPTLTANGFKPVKELDKDKSDALTETQNVLSSLKFIKETLNSGIYTGIGSGVANAVGSKVGLEGATRQAFSDTTKDMMSQVLKMRSGLTVSDKERANLEAFLPGLGKGNETNKRNIENFERTVRTVLRNNEKTLKAQGYDTSAITEVLDGTLRDQYAGTDMNEYASQLKDGEGLVINRTTGELQAITSAEYLQDPENYIIQE